MGGVMRSGTEGMVEDMKEVQVAIVEAMVRMAKLDDMIAMVGVASMEAAEGVGGRGGLGESATDNDLSSG